MAKDSSVVSKKIDDFTEICKLGLKPAQWFDLLVVKCSIIYEDDLGICKLKNISYQSEIREFVCLENELYFWNLLNIFICLIMAFYYTF